MKQSGNAQLSGHWDLCRILTLERARRILPAVVGRDAQDVADDQRGAFAYWCSWTDKPVPTNVAVEVAHAGKVLNDVQIIDGDWKPGDDHSRDEAVPGVGSEAFWTHDDEHPSGVLRVVVKTADGTKWTSFDLVAGAQTCDEDGACLEVPHSGDRLKPRMIAVARSVADDVKAKLG